MLRNGERLQKRLRGMPPALSEALEAAVARVTEAARAEAAESAPVNTGRLRESISTRVVAGGGRAEGAVFTDCPYAAAVEMGTSRRPGTPFLSPAAKRARNEFFEEAAGAAREAARR